MRLTHVVTAVAVLAVLSGCQRTTYNGLSSPGVQPLAQPQPLQPAPVGGVQSSDLASPKAGANDFPTAPQAATQDVTQLSANSQDVTKEELIGRWTLNSGGATCDIFLSLTKWTGGYRAASRGCSGGAAVISAWDVQGKQVVLADSAGTRVARLYKSANERYNGSTTGGQAVSMSR
jgi:hypothetical protein